MQEILATGLGSVLSWPVFVAVPQPLCVCVCVCVVKQV